MKRKASSFQKKATLISMILLLFVISACGAKASSDTQSTDQGAASTSTDTGKDLPLKGKKIALIMHFNIGTFSAQYIEGVKEEVKRFGGEVSVFASDNDLTKMASNLNVAITQQFDGILTDHGTAEALQAGVQKAVDSKIPVVSFDAALKIPGVTVLEQGDQKMADMTLEQLGKDIGGKGNIVKVWVAGFAPMERRQLAYQEFMAKNPGIKEIATFGAASANTALDTQAQMEAILKQYPNKGDISAVWTAWDEFAKGAARAIQQAGRDEIKVYGIDMSDEDLQMIQDKANPWVASAAVDPKDIGRVQVRYLYQKLHGDTTEDTVVLEPVFVHRDALPAEQVSTTELSKYIEGWGSSTQGLLDWMKDYEK
ncbi:LacI family transcriptional regulator [Paenibacillus selenitireducens]|uniref:LacI family transcriptional regulator n=1 Tax=Paenibacillus selenitireducens TaxID=1324314 RepID=A0A1T2XNI3_9BACL|nr:sugar ABC transporter substrate-binding protein [Paenibacillus selenitireducens]OPA81434.1 LacI family transcriptional regulator [Paenibacillus selenitireducens]